jgi:lipopolysaccharide/colanic/teichoic acid biosynthesis glycosyltransferase
VILRRWEDLPASMKNDSVSRYYQILSNKKLSLLAKRIFDIVFSLLMLILLFPIFIIISIIIKVDSRGPIMFRQVRITQYGKKFRIFKFRTMVENAETTGSQVTTKNDNRVTNIGKILRKYRLDELPQLLNIIVGDMSFVGTRPEVEKYVEKYTDTMMATLLLPAGVTSQTSVEYKDEEQLLAESDDIDKLYVENILPSKMNINLKSIEEFSILTDIKIILKTVFVVFS